MEQQANQPVLALLCDRQGTIEHVLRDDFRTGMMQGELWISLVDPGSLMKAINFLREIGERGAVYDWEITLRLGKINQPLHCAGGTVKDQLLIVASSSAGIDRFYEEEMQKILSGYTHMIHDQMTRHEDTDQSFIDESSRLNSELMSIQRELARRNSELAEKTRFIQRIFEAVPNLLMVYDLREQRLVFANREIIVSLGYTPDEIQKMGSSFLRQLMHPDDVPVLESHNQRIYFLPDGETLEVEFRLKDAMGEWRWISSRDTVFERDADGIPNQILSAAQDVTDRKRVQEKLWYLSTHDALTGLYNRGYFYEEMARIEKSRSYPISILIVDLDDLKKTNDTFGHSTGDELLRRAAGVLKSCFRPGEVIARIGGDEFAVLLDHTGSHTAQSVIDRVRRMIDIDARSRPGEIHLGMSVGIATAEAPTALLEIYKQADSQMYSDKVGRKQTGRLNSAIN